MSVDKKINNKALADKVKKLTSPTMSEFDAARKVIDDEIKAISAKAEALKQRINA